VEKPFGVGGVLTRLRVVLRQRGQAQGPLEPIRAGAAEIDLEKHMVARDSGVVKVCPANTTSWPAGLRCGARC
jgi:two-component system KDP operon response regulator KdpE